MFDVKHSLCEKIVKSIKATKLNGNPTGKASNKLYLCNSLLQSRRYRKS